MVWSLAQAMACEPPTRAHRKTLTQERLVSLLSCYWQEMWQDLSQITVSMGVTRVRQVSYMFELKRWVGVQR